MNLPGSLQVAPASDLYDDLAHDLLRTATAAVRQRGVCHVALSGGSTPEPFYERLILDPRYRAIPWKQTHIWIVDERQVPVDHEKSNWRMIKHTLTDHLPVKSRQLHPMPVLTAEPAAAYIDELRAAFPPLAASRQSTPRFDFILLGMGDDAHTASLFPHSPALTETRWIATNEGPHVTPPPRVTMTFPLLNAAGDLAVLCVGGKKLPTLRRVAEQLAARGPDAAAMPITGIQPEDGRLTWYLDPAAAGREGEAPAEPGRAGSAGQ